MEKSQLSRITDLVADDVAPRTSVLVPEVRSGGTFSYAGKGETEDRRQAFLIVWFYTVEPNNRLDFARKIAAFEGTMDSLGSVGTATDGRTPSSVVYRGTYSVSISSAAPDLEYRTLWGLTELSKLQELNDYLRNPGTPFKEVLKLISPRPIMRSEIMGLTQISASFFD